MKDYFTFLRDVYFFKELSDEDIRRIHGYCKEDSFRAGEVIFYENDSAERFFIVTKGIVEVWKAWGSKDADMLASHGVGRLFGEMALVDDMPRSATVIARSDTEVLYIMEEDFQRIVKENSSVSFSIIRSLSAMVRKSNETFLDDLKERNRQLETAYKELKQAQKELLRNERFSNLGKFSSFILHDLRNPLSVLKGYSEILMMSDELSDKTRKYVKNIGFEAERMNNLANELLDYSRGEIRLNMSVVTPSAFLADLEDHLGRRLGSKIKLEINCGIEHPVIFDRERIFRALTNLSENARKAMHDGGTLSISLTTQAERLMLQVCDTGEGMSPEVLNHIFEPFYSSSKGGGTGLGMVIVQNVVQAHDGTLEITSTPGEGTEVTLNLPLHD